MFSVGFIGLGLMGSRMCKRILDAGYPLTVWNRTADKAQPLLAAGARWAGSPRQVAAAADVVITMVTNSQAVEAVTGGSDGVLAGAHPGMILMDMSSIDPATSRAVAERARAAGITMLDAPVAGSTPAVEKGILGIMVGGPAEALETVRPLLGVLGAKIVHMGPNGAGVTMKLLNQIVMGVALEINAEALVLARKAGLDPQLVLEVLGSGGARTAAGDMRGPWMVQHDFAPRFSIANQLKDLTYALEMAQELGVPVPVAAIAHEIYQTARAQGKGGLDSGAVITALESMANLNS